jgi:hypothetical protein
VTSTWAALSPAKACVAAGVAGRMGSYGICCGAAQCEQPRGSRDEWRAALDAGGLATATTTCGPPRAKETRGSNRDPKVFDARSQGNGGTGWPCRR